MCYLNQQVTCILEIYIYVKAPLANSSINWIYDSPPSQSHHIAPRQTTPKSKTNMVPRKSPEIIWKIIMKTRLIILLGIMLKIVMKTRAIILLHPLREKGIADIEERERERNRNESFIHDAHWATQRSLVPASSRVPVGMTHSGPQDSDPISAMRPAVYYPPESVGNSLTNDNSSFQIDRESGEFPGLYKPADPDSQHDTRTYSSIANSLDTGPPSPTRTLAASSSDSRTRTGIVYPRQPRNRRPDICIEVEASLPEPAAFRRADLQPPREAPTSLPRTHKRLSRKRRRNRSTALYRPAKRSPPQEHWCEV